MSHLFRQAMRRLSYPTMIITSAVPKGTKASNFHGLTISSMTSLSVNPTPLVQFNIRTPSQTSEDIKKNSLFAIHFLQPNNVGIQLAKQFSQGIKSMITSPFDKFIDGRDYICYDTENLPISSDKMLPLLKGTGKILICRSKERFEIQDHEIWIGEVLDTVSIPIGDSNDSNHGGLLHCNSQFFKLGDLI